MMMMMSTKKQFSKDYFILDIQDEYDKNKKKDRKPAGKLLKARCEQLEMEVMYNLPITSN